MNDESLLRFRHSIAQYSLKKAALRVALQQYQASQPTVPSQIPVQWEPIGSQIVDDRVPSSCCFHPSEPLLAVSGWSGKVTIWSLPNATLHRTLTSHNDRVHSVTYSSTGLLLTASADKTVILWSDQPVSFTGHTDRVNDAVFLCGETSIASVSHDTSVRLWDVPSSREILRQDGHARPVYALAGHPDGSLLLTGDLGGVVLVWDLRTGKAVMHLRGHLKQVLSVSVSPNGYIVATGSDDNTVRMWDLRRHGLIYTLPAHEKLVSTVHCELEKVYSGSYDHSVKVWSVSDWSLQATIPHSNKVTCVRYSPSSSLLATCSFDKTLKLYHH